MDGASARQDNLHNDIFGGSMKKFELYDEITLNKQIDELSRRGINKGCRGTIAEIGDKKNLVLFYNHADFGDYAFAWVADEDLDYSGKYPEWLLNDFIKFIKTHDPAKKLSFSKTELQEYDFVELTVDRKEYADEGVHKGMCGTILNPEKIRGCWQVYFSDETGADFAAVPVREEDLKLIKR